MIEPYDIVVIGSLNMDLVVRAERMPRPGETLTGQEFRTVPGGKGANQALAAARLGARVAMVGCVGSDAFSHQLIDGLRSEGVDVSLIRSEAAESTGTATILLDHAGESRIIVVPGANGCVAGEDVISATDLLRGARFLMMQLEVPLSTVEMALAAAEDLGVPVILNAAPAQPLSDDILRQVRILVVNETEASALSGLEVVDLVSAEQAAGRLRERGVSTVILTMGRLGAVLADGDTRLHLPVRPVQVVDATAAGDAFIGGLAASLAHGADLPGAVRFANAAGALAVTRFGAQTSLPTRAEVEAFDPFCRSL